MKDKLFSALKNSKADYTEIRFETEESNLLSYRGPEIEHVACNKFDGGIVRTCLNGGWGLSIFDSLEGLNHQVSESYNCAKLRSIFVLKRLR